jgi:hypothetical protein
LSVDHGSRSKKTLTSVKAWDLPIGDASMLVINLIKIRGKVGNSRTVATKESLLDATIHRCRFHKKSQATASRQKPQVTGERQQRTKQLS